MSAPITVVLIAVPMALGLSLAAGAPPEAGLAAAAAGGIAGGPLSGAPLQVSDPSAGLAVVSAGPIQIYGWRTTCTITSGAGLSQILLGTLRVARGALAASPAIAHGTLAGIGIGIGIGIRGRTRPWRGGSPKGRSSCPACTSASVRRRRIR
ncbi:SulP family inorganic anion transporter [Streptomyces rhizosphaericola]|uniref:SLC26A/SulP transporter domain-containing protein n=1 Tax=Streptomyces rhizosphaericola TaxID=2564098 RepID=A0ABY2PDM3_9ACTN|nr:hypothetical protein E5Z02_16915 [Streptomyces rhizosphaericola]